MKCLMCGEKLILWQKKFCSHKCHYKFNIGKKRPNWVGTKIKKAKRGKSNGRLGIKHTKKTKEKIGLANRGWIPSEKTRKLWIKQRKGRRISEKTKIKMSEAQKRIGNKPPIKNGKEHWNWQGGKTSKDIKIRNSIEIKLWRKSNMERDNFTCQKCLIIGGKLCVHHINNFADFKELRTSINNGITFCRNCHKEFHKKYGKKYNTIKQLEEFLKN